MRKLFAVLAFATLTSTVRADTISTLPEYVPPFNFSSSDGIFGQTFLATPSDSVLTSATFEINNPLSNAVNFTAYVFAIGNSSGPRYLSGPALFTSPVLSLPVSSPADSYNPIKISTGAVSLVPGQEYLVFVDAGNVGNVGPGSPPTVSFGLVFGPNDYQYYPYGSAQYSVPFDPANPSESPFFTLNQDAAFALQFQTAVPEPGGLASATVGLLFLFVVAFACQRPVLKSLWNR